MRHQRKIMNLVLLALISACTSAAPPPSTATSSSAAAATVVPSNPDPYNGVAIVAIDAQVFAAGGNDVGYLGITANSVWAATIDGLVRIDPRTNAVKQIDHGAHFGIAMTGEAVWTTDPDQEIALRFDPVKGTQTARVELLGYPESMGALGDSVWVAQHRRGSVTRLREPSGDTVAQVDVGPAGRGGPHGVAVTSDSVWVGVTNISSVVRIDPSTNAVVATIPTATSPCGGIAVQPDAVWVSSCYDDHFAIRIDPRTNKNVAEIDLGGNNGGAVLVDGYPWFPVANRLIRIDPATNRIDRILEFTSQTFEGFGSAVGFDSVWVGGFNGLIARIPVDALMN